jgi:hypothetical protein
MAIKVAFSAGPLVIGIGLSLLLSAIDPGTAGRFAILALAAVIIGGALGVFADRLPDLPRWMRFAWPRSRGDHRTHGG